MQQEFEYFYGHEAEQFTFFRIPKILFSDKRFKSMTTDAKLLYGLMLDRMGLSIKNRWIDRENRVYIIYTMEDIIEDLGCARQKVSKILEELDKTVGLIERKRQGLGKPNVIYVKNFATISGKESLSCETEDMSAGNPEVPKSYLQKYENHTSRSLKTELLEVPKSNANNNYYNNTDYSETILSYQDTEETMAIRETTKETDMIGWMRERKKYQQEIKRNIEYERLIETLPESWLDEIIELMLDVVLSTEPYIRINKQNYPQESVKARFLKIDSTHMEYIYDALRENTSNVRNIRAFLITTIYRSVETVDNWYAAKINYDMNQTTERMFKNE